MYVDARPVVAIIAPLTATVRGRVYIGSIVRNKKPFLVRPGPKCFGNAADVTVGVESWARGIAGFVSGLSMSFLVLSASWRRS